MKKVLTVILLFMFVACGDSFSNDSSKKDLKKINVSNGAAYDTGGGDANTPPPPPGG